jgi:hypothetical protein
MRTMNVFATTEEDLYKDPFPKPAPTRSFDSIIDELNTVKTAEANELRSQFWQLAAQISEMLANHRAEKLASLEEKLETAILESRKLQKAFHVAKDASIAALQQHTRSASASKNASNKHEAMVDEFKQKTLLTKSEKAEWVERIAAAKQRAESTFLAESSQLSVYNQIVRVEAEAAKAYIESVNAANEFQREINRLSSKTA